MIAHRPSLAFIWLLMKCVSASMAIAQGASSDAEDEVIRATELRRLQALVAADIATAEELHAPGFELIHPRGGVLNRTQYLGAVGRGEIDYLLWEPVTEIEVRRQGDLAIIRYRSRLENVIYGTHSPPTQIWHTDTYEKRDGRWVIVRSHATIQQD